MIYVTQTQLIEFLGVVDEAALSARVAYTPGGWQPLVRRASNLVADATANAHYATHLDGTPKSAVLAQAFTDATCAQVEAWITSQIDPALGVAQVTRRVASKSALGVSVTFEQSSATAYLESLAAGSYLVPEAWGYLNRAGLIDARLNHGTDDGITRLLPTADGSPLGDFVIGT